MCKIVQASEALFYTYDANASAIRSWKIIHGQLIEIAILFSCPQQ